MPKLKVRPQVCDQCPFRRLSAPGWLGENRPEDFAYIATEGQGIACHSLVDQENEQRRRQQEKSAARCRGALVMMANSCKLPVSKELAALRRTVQVDPAIFSHEQEFIAHHRSGVQSWLEEEEDED